MSSLVFLPACKPWQWVKDKLGLNKAAGAARDEATKMADESFILRVGSEKAKDNFLKKNDADPDE